MILLQLIKNKFQKIIMITIKSNTGEKNNNE